MDTVYSSGITKRWYKREYIDALPPEKQLDVIHNINPENGADMAILETWIEHFRTADVPFIVKRHLSAYNVPTLVLWKEKRI